MAAKQKAEAPADPQPKEREKRNLIDMTKDGETIPVHPDSVAEHERLGWVAAD